jgi:hypothetical protein
MELAYRAIQETSPKEIHSLVNFLFIQWDLPEKIAGRQGKTLGFDLYKPLFEQTLN